jgi:hypothetical protein
MDRLLPQMADTTAAVPAAVVVAPASNLKVNEESEITCQCCEKLKLELDKVLLELVLAQEIIRLLQGTVQV